MPFGNGNSNKTKNKRLMLNIVEESNRKESKVNSIQSVLLSFEKLLQ